ncbi:uncharacterized protein LOC119296149 isoform X2 [Triticum dicoccoides]|uniref:uncharacterized protein LOC119296149 isoform X2 n=1 Tax=Triticum dicoccoides TaxID=85692 RepID=UPI00188DD907|nr:uncharacterized protein LOC119296149 isoform X2 [Triticum dicoccoides]
MSGVRCAAAALYKELEQHVLIYKYLVAGVPVPPDLRLPIRRGFDSLASHFYQLYNALQISTGPPGRYPRPTTTMTKVWKHGHLPDFLKLDSGLPRSRPYKVIADVGVDPAWECLVKDSPDLRAAIEDVQEYSACFGCQTKIPWLGEVRLSWVTLAY